MSALHIVSDSSSNQIEFAHIFETFEQGLDSRVAPSSHDIVCHYVLDDTVHLLSDTTADVSSRYYSGSSPSLRRSMREDDTTSLKQTDRQTFAKQIPIQSRMYCML